MQKQRKCTEHQNGAMRKKYEKLKWSMRDEQRGLCYDKCEGEDGNVCLGFRGKTNFTFGFRV